MEINKTIKKSNWLALIILMLILSFVAGIFGELFTRTYLSNLSFFRDFYFTEQSDLGQREIIIRDAKKVVIEQDIRLNQLINEVRPSVLGLYKKPVAGKTLLDNLLAPTDLIGQVFVLTSDGWLISSSDAVNRPKEGMSVYYNNKIYPIEKIIKDELSKIVFLKINIQNLPVIKLADLQKVTNGQQIFLYNSYYNQISLGNIIDRNFKSINTKNDLVFSSQAMDKYILVNNDFINEAMGTPVFNLEGEIIGLLDGESDGFSKVIPINYISPIINQVLKDETIQRPYLGVYYLNLSRVVGLTEEDKQQSETGALIWPNKNGVAIQADSPLAGILVKGDIIISIENQLIDENNDLIDLLLGYKSGQEIRLKYLHEGKKNEINILLK